MQSKLGQIHFDDIDGRLGAGDHNGHTLLFVELVTTRSIRGAVKIWSRWHVFQGLSANTPNQPGP